jgi:LuxR family maltose regulon positive regulatory protein
MGSQGLQTEKSIPGVLPEICAPREELLNKFDKAADKRYIYINAPAGCGKTVSALLWIRKSGRRTIWLGLDQYDNTPAMFYRFFCNALLSAVPQDESLMRIVRDPAFGNSPVEYSAEIISRLSFDGGEYALVLDDFHFITDREILKSLVYVARRLPLSVTVLILSRNELPRTLSSLAEAGRIAFIGASELAFKCDEIRRHFACFGRFITTEEAEAAFSLTEGWAIAVNALILSGNSRADEAFKDNPLGKYIKTKIWDKFGEDLRRFMMRTSVVDGFTAELCERMTGNPESTEILDMLCGGNLFLSRQNDEYRYHHLFLEFLRGETAKEMQAELKALYQRAADYYFAAGEHFNTLRYFVKSGDSNGMAVALHEFLISADTSEMLKLLFINELPAGILEENPFLCVGGAWCALLFSDAKRMFFYLDRLYERLGDMEKKHREFLEIVLFVFTADPRYSFTEQIARFQSNITIEAQKNNLQKVPNHKLPFFHRSYRDYSYCALDPEVHFAEFLRALSAILHRHYQIIRVGVEAGLLYEQNLLKEAMALLESMPASDHLELVFLSKMHRAACLLAMGKEEEAALCRAETKTFLGKENLLYLGHAFLAYETKIKLMDGNKEAARAWLGNYFITEAQSPELTKIFLHFTTVRAYAVLGEFEKARTLCEKLKKLAQEFYRPLDIAEAAALLAVLKWKTGKRPEAEAILQASLATMEPYHFVRVFADEGKAILPVLQSLLKKSEKTNGSMPGYRYLQEIYRTAYEQSKRYKGFACAADQKPVRLSGQQKHVLALLAKGYKNAEIVALTGLTINTIRSHTKAAYRKLEVNNALDAVNRAKQQGFLD